MATNMVTLPRFARLLCLASALLIGAACDQDPFGFCERTVVRDYRLKQWEDFTTYYLVGGPQPEHGGGAIDGIALRLAWNRRYILVQRQATAGGTVAWVVVDAEQRTVGAPMSESEVRAIPEFARLLPTAIPADSAWRSLH